MHCGDVVYYGSMEDEYVVKLEIKSKKRVLDMDVTGKVDIQLMCTNPGIRARRQIVRSSEGGELYLAMDITDVWL